MTDLLNLYGQSFDSRFLIGSALYPSPQIMCDSVTASKANIITVALRRQAPEQGGGKTFWDYIKSLDVTLMPNTAGCHNAKEAITLAKLLGARMAGSLTCVWSATRPVHPL